MLNLTTAVYFILSIGILTSVSILGLHQILLFVPTVYCLYQGFVQKKKNYTLSSLFLLIFMMWCLVSLGANYSDLQASGKSFGKMKFFFYALGGASVLNYWLPQVKLNHLRFIIHTFFFAIIATGLVAIYQVAFLNEIRSPGFIGIMRYGYCSAFISTLLLASILHYEKLRPYFNLKFAMSALAFSLIGLLLTKTRGALGGFVCGVPFILYFFKPKLGLLAALVSLILVSIIGYAYLFGSNNYGSRYLKSKNEIGDVVRREQWKSAIIATQEHPVFGWGYSNFASQVERIKKENNFETVFYKNAHAHNVFLEIAAGTGFIGFAIFLIWLITWAYECFKLENVFRGVFVPFGVNFIVSGQFEMIFDTTNMILIFFVYSLSQFAMIKQTND